MTLTNEQRILNVINRRDVDFLPSQITMADRTRDKELSIQLGLSSAAELDSYMGNHIHITFSADDVPLVYRNDIEKMKEYEARGFCGVDVENHVVYDKWGVGIQMYADGFFPCFHPLQQKYERNEIAEKFMPPGFNRDVLKLGDLEEAVRCFKAPDAYAKGNFDLIEYDLKKYSGDFLVICSGYGGMYERSYHVMGFEELMMEIAAQPEVVEELLDKILEYKIAFARKCVERGAKVGHTGDDLGTQYSTLFSKEMFRRIFKPRYAKLFNVYKSAGIPVAMHSCGNITEFIPDLIDAGLDILEPVQPCMDLKFLKREFGKDLIFWGGIDTQQILPYGSPEQIEEMVRETIHILGKGGGYIAAPSQEITKDVPVENIKALVETVIIERERVLQL